MTCFLNLVLGGGFRLSQTSSVGCSEFSLLFYFYFLARGSFP